MVGVVQIEILLIKVTMNISKISLMHTFSNVYIKSKSETQTISVGLIYIFGLSRAHSTLVIRPVVVKWEGS